MGNMDSLDLILTVAAFIVGIMLLTGHGDIFMKGGNAPPSKRIEQNNRSKNRRVKVQDVSGRNYFVESDYDCGEEESL